MRLVGIDFETQNADAKTTNITEVGASLYEKVDGTWVKKDGFSQLVYEENYPAQSDFIVDLTGITDAMLKAEGCSVIKAFGKFIIPMMNKADVIFAHKKSFDQTVLECTAKRKGIIIPVKEWVCTLTEFPWPEKYTCKKLSHLAYDHGILVDPRTLHRAEQDVDLMMELITTRYDIDEVLKFAREPWVYLRANTLEPWKDNGKVKQTDVAKALGFGWEKIRHAEEFTFPKKWVTRLKERNVDKLVESVEKSEAPFPVSIIEGLS